MLEEDRLQSAYLDTFRPPRLRIGREIDPQALQQRDVIVLDRRDGLAVRQYFRSEALQRRVSQLAGVRALSPLFAHEREEHADADEEDFENDLQEPLRPVSSSVAPETDRRAQHRTPPIRRPIPAHIYAAPERHPTEDRPEGRRPAQVSPARGQEAAAVSMRQSVNHVIDAELVRLIRCVERKQALAGPLPILGRA